jgi:hypothetical protein
MFKFVVLGPDETTTRFVLDLMFAGAIHDSTKQPYHRSFYEQTYFFAQQEHSIVVHHDPNWRHPFGYLDDVAIFVGEPRDLLMDEQSFADWKNRFRDVIFLSPGSNSAELRENISAAVAQLANVLDEPKRQTFMVNVNLLNANILAEKLNFIGDVNLMRPIDDIIVSMCIDTANYKSYTEQLFEFFLGLEFIFCLSPERFHHWYALRDNDSSTQAIEQDIQQFRKKYKQFLQFTTNSNPNRPSIPYIGTWKIISTLIRALLFRKVAPTIPDAPTSLQKQFDALLKELQRIAKRMASF